MQPFDFSKNRERLEKAVDKHIKLAGLSDPEGFTLIEGFVAPTIHQVLSDNMVLSGRALSVIAVVGNKSGLIHYFYLDTLFPGEGLE